MEKSKDVICNWIRPNTPIQKEDSIDKIAIEKFRKITNLNLDKSEV